MSWVVFRNEHLDFITSLLMGNEVRSDKNRERDRPMDGRRNPVALVTPSHQLFSEHTSYSAAGRPPLDFFLEPKCRTYL